MLRVYLIQTDSSKGSKVENLARAKGLILDAHPSEGNLILLPEMFATGYIPVSLDAAAEDFNSRDSGETANMLSEVASATNCTVMGAGIKKAGNKFLNHVSVYTPSTPKESCAYDKMNLFFPEKETFKAGEKINLFNIKDWKTASFICYDLRFPEIFRAVSDAAEVLVVAANWPERRIAHWNKLLEARAIENQSWVLGVNCVGEQQTLHYNGSSRAVTPEGETAECLLDREGILFCEIGEEAARFRRSFPALQDRRNALYQKLLG